MIMKKMKNLMIAIVVAMPVFLCGCPGDNCVDENDPKGYVVKMKNDYTDMASALMYVNASGDTTYCCVLHGKRTTKITGNYYKLSSASYDDIVYLSIKLSDWDDKYLDSLYIYVIDTNPFEEVYVYHHNYDLDALKTIIENNSLNTLERLK